MIKLPSRSAKARSIFFDTETACRVYIQNNGYETNPNGSAVGFATVKQVGYQHEITKYTLTEMRKQLEFERSNMHSSVEMKKRFGGYEWLTDENIQLQEQTYKMVESTINNHLKRLTA